MAVVTLTTFLAFGAIATAHTGWPSPSSRPSWGYLSGDHTASACSSPPSPPSKSACGYAGGGPTATINAGIVIGTTTSLPAATATVNKFLGVPFAKSPPTRFAPPQSPGSFESPIDATAWSPACIQQFVYPLASQQFTEAVFNNPAPEESEDCLYLNVYAPSTPAPADGRTVMFWIYGGSLEFGNAGQPFYDGSWFASYEDVIVVTANYRTNVFGFPSSPELPLTGHNLGFLDQRFALDWVQQNIAAFGGSPDKVTIFGESAGAFSIDALLTSFPKDSSPPFRGAILQSGQYSYRSAPFTSSVPAWDALSAVLGCPGSYSSNLTCVRAASATDIQSIIDKQSLAFPPSPDNVTLVANPAKQRLSGNIARIPVMGGTDTQEGRVFTVGQTNATAFLQTIFGPNPALISTVLAAYPIGSAGISSVYDQTSAIFTDYIFQCPQAKWANDTAALGIPTWRYLFNASFANTQAYPGLGVYHSSEIPIVFSTYNYVPANTTTQEYALSNAMRSAWAKFAKNPAGGPGWNAVGTGAAGQVLSGATGSVSGGVLVGANGNAVNGTFDLGLWGNRGDAMGAGVTVIDQKEVDYRCGVFEAVLDTIAGTTGQ